MGVREKIVTALQPLGIETYHMQWRGEGSPPDKYFVFTMMRRPAVRADDVTRMRETYIYLNLYGDADVDLTPIADEADEKMQAAGFIELERSDFGRTTRAAKERENNQVAWTWKLYEVV